MKRYGRRGAILGVIIAALIAAGSALAYLALFSGTTGTSTVTGGTGYGSGDSQASAAVQVTATGADYSGGSNCTALGPGCTESFSLKATNLNTGAAETLQSLAMPTITTSNPSGCPASWFTWSYGGSSDATPNLSLPVGATGVSFGDSLNTLSESEQSSQQNGCVGATISLSFAGGTTNP